MNSLMISRYYEPISPIIREFLEALEETDLCYRASSLEEVFETADDISMAVRRAMLVCSRAGIPMQKHFCAVYVADDQGLRTDWKLSKFAFSLVVLNGNADMPVVGRMQLELLRDLL